MELVRSTGQREKNGEVVRLAVVDPLNLTGIVTPSEPVASVMGQHVTYVDGVPQAHAQPLHRGSR